MNILIIGGGWVGCHLAMKLRDKHNITIFDKNIELFCETSFKNQNRLHYGFHYPRNHRTRMLCKDTYQKFIDEYGFLVEDVKNNVYCVPNKSLIDFDTFKTIFRDFEYDIYNDKFSTDGCIKTKEKFINYRVAKEFFNKELKHLFKQIKVDTIEELKNNYDLILNCTNNNIPSDNGYFYELTISLIIEKIKDINFDSLTLMDGKFFSIYPYDNNLFTLTDVEYTPFRKFKNINDLEVVKKEINDNVISDIKNKMFNKVNEYFPIDEYFTYKDYFLSLKVKNISESDDRYPTIIKNDNVVNIYTGKIQGIFTIEEYIKNLINENTTLL